MASERQKSTLSQNGGSTICNISTIWRGGRATRLPAWSCDRRHRPLSPKKRKESGMLVVEFKVETLVSRNVVWGFSSFLLSTPKRKEAKEKARKPANCVIPLSPNLGGLGVLPQQTNAICWKHELTEVGQ